MINGKRILITGGGGFVGTALAERLEQDNELTLMDIDFDNNAFSFSNLIGKRNIHLVRANILEAQQEIAEATREAQIVIHTAAMLGVQEVISNAIRTLEVNYSGTSNILKGLSGSKMCERFVFFSTSEIFGSNAFRITESGDSILSSVQDVRWCYCISKLAAEHLSFGYFRQKGLPVVVVRPFNIFGPLRVGDYVVARFILRALQNENLEIYGDGSQIRAWCYIDDFCDALLQTIQVKEAVGQAFNIGNSGNTLTIRALAEMVISLCGSRSKIVSKAPNFTDIDIRVPDASKAREMLGFNPKVGIKDGLKMTIEWVEKNFERIKNIAKIRKKRYLV